MAVLLELASVSQAIRRLRFAIAIRRRLLFRFWKLASGADFAIVRETD